MSRVLKFKIGFDTKEQIADSSLVRIAAGADVVENLAANDEAPNTVNSSVRTREYLTEAEIDRLMAAARKLSRYGHRDATMILIGYRHGLRASELCDLQWSQVELAAGRLHVRRAKNGSPSVHPLQGAARLSLNYSSAIRSTSHINARTLTRYPTHQLLSVTRHWLQCPAPHH